MIPIHRTPRPGPLQETVRHSRPSSISLGTSSTHLQRHLRRRGETSHQKHQRPVTLPPGTQDDDISLQEVGLSHKEAPPMAKQPDLPQKTRLPPSNVEKPPVVYGLCSPVSSIQEEPATPPHHSHAGTSGISVQAQNHLDSTLIQLLTKTIKATELT